LKKLEALRGTVIVGDILAPLYETWAGDADHIGATTMAHQAPLITADEKLRATLGLRCIW
jgi:hypothetical protein